MANDPTTRVKRRASVPLLAWLALAAWSAHGAEPTATPLSHTSGMPARFPIRVEQVVSAAGRELPLEAASVSLVAPLTASTKEPALAVTGIEPWGDRRARIRIACQRHEQCLAFYAVAEWPDAYAAKTALSGALTHAPAGQSQAAKQAPAGRTAAASVAAARAVGDTPSEMIAKSGAHATLLLEGERMHIKVPVICLESGEVGRTIRVAAADHKQTYSAEVVDATLLKGTL